MYVLLLVCVWRFSDVDVLTLHFITPTTLLHSQTGVWSGLALVEEEFIAPIRSGLRETRSFYSRKLTELEDDKSGDNSVGMCNLQYNMQ